MSVQCVSQIYFGLLENDQIRIVFACDICSIKMQSMHVLMFAWKRL